MFSWLAAVYALCLMRAALLPGWSTNPATEAITWPILHWIGSVWFGMILMWGTGSGPEAKVEDEHIRENFPRLWRLLHPLGKHSYNQFAIVALLRHPARRTDLVLAGIADSVLRGWRFIGLSTLLIPLCALVAWLSGHLW